MSDIPDINSPGEDSFTPSNHNKRLEEIQTSARREIEDEKLVVNLEQPADVLDPVEGINSSLGPGQPDYLPTAKDIIQPEEVTGEHATDTHTKYLHRLTLHQAAVMRALGDLCAMQDNRIGQLRDLSEKDLADIDAAVRYQNRMASLVPDKFPLKGHMLNSLGRFSARTRNER
ncbi:hypothetical protein FRC08_010618 [Ceratobasidium sp. 394]|nr:hypothetical protein FRC08_010618 [Ceratobasidium sp. 394]